MSNHERPRVRMTAYNQGKCVNEYRDHAIAVLKRVTFLPGWEFVVDTDADLEEGNPAQGCIVFAKCVAAGRLYYGSVAMVPTGRARAAVTYDLVRAHLFEVLPTAIAQAQALMAQEQLRYDGAPLMPAPETA